MPKRILVLRYRFIGDTILTVPFLRNLRKAEPDAYIAWLAAPGSFEVAAGTPYVDEVIFWDPPTIHADSRSTHKTPGQKLAFLRELRARRFDKAYVLKRSFGSAVIALLSGARQRVGFSTEGRRLLLTKGVPYRHDQHEVQNFLDVLRADGVPVSDDHLEAWLSEEEGRFAAEFFRMHGVGEAELVIGIHPFAANAARGWHLERFTELSRLLRDRLGARVLFFGGKGDAEAFAAIRQALPAASLEAVGSTTLRQTMALLSRCNLLVCNDSGIMHLGASLRVPLVALFGPQSPVKFGPWGDSCRVIYHAFPCSPCRQKFFEECQPSAAMKPLCIESITVSEVFETVATLLDEVSTTR